MKCSDIKSSDFKTPIIVQLMDLRPSEEDGIPIKTVIKSINKKAKLYTGNSLTLKRQELLQSQGFNVKKCFEFIVRFMDLDNTYTVLYKDKQYEVKDIEDVEEKGRYLVLLCERIE